MKFPWQFRLWHLFALVTAVSVLCAFPSVRFIAIGVLLVMTTAWAFTLGFLFLTRATLALIALAAESAARFLSRH